jgi:hypothetical protein
MKEKENNKKNDQKEKDNIKRAKFREKRSSSSSSIFLDTTISTPIVKNIIKAVAILLKTQLNEDSTMTKTISKESDLYYFSEEKYIEDFPQYFDAQKKENIHKIPSTEDIMDFMEALYNCVQFSPECCIICLMYIYRIIALTGLSLRETNWRPLIFVSLMVSQKIWDDNVLPNGDFSIIYPFFDNDQLNELEIKFMEIIQYNVYVTLSNYMTFYLNLRSLVENQVELKPLSKFSLKKMEHLINEKKVMKLKRSDSHGKFLKEGEKGSFVIN